MRERIRGFRDKVQMKAFCGLVGVNMFKSGQFRDLVKNIGSDLKTLAAKEGFQTRRGYLVSVCGKFAVSKLVSAVIPIVDKSKVLQALTSPVGNWVKGKIPGGAGRELGWAASHVSEKSLELGGKEFAAAKTKDAVSKNLAPKNEKLTPEQTAKVASAGENAKKIWGLAINPVDTVLGKGVDAIAHKLDNMWAKNSSNAAGEKKLSSPANEKNDSNTPPVNLDELK